MPGKTLQTVCPRTMGLRGEPGSWKGESARCEGAEEIGEGERRAPLQPSGA